SDCFPAPRGILSHADDTDGTDANFHLLFWRVCIGHSNLLSAGERVVVLDNLATGFDWAVAQGALLVIGVAGNTLILVQLFVKHRVDAIIHFAASVVVEDSVRDPLGYYRNNTMNSRELIETAVKEGVCHFVFSSTAAVYGNP